MKDIWEEDCAAPAKVVKRMLEKDVQKQCIDWARARGYWCRKFSSMTQNSVPDYLLARMNAGRRIKLAVEFKAPGKKSTPAQIDEQEAMRLAGWAVFSDVDSFDKFKATVLAYEAEQI